ncbi:MAG TPA: bifunctional DNA-formamidopyrimidine glycosylase/DNA-(apurinic or apyrimidinic site) lyase, partial [Candidatus Saccharimonadales bacterium]|nr:bifunctional DNA-formamidopyrimidine glycosylase/DNA-(apurinic or apyrimidinic site) lyase [Candidatus Saccharimonadales bacterium]
EVETVRIGLSRFLPGKRVAQVEHDWPRGFPNTPSDVQAFLIGARIVQVRRRAKVLLIDLDTAYTLVIHLKMTGQLVYQSRQERFGAGHPSASLVGELPDRSTRVVFTFPDRDKLFFNDQRKFGWVRLLPTVEVEDLDFFRKVGPEPLAADFAADDFVERLLRRPRSNIKAVLLDQTVVAGIGNIYADESLWGAKIHPETKVHDISRAKLVTLHKVLVGVLRTSIEKGGSTDRNYVNAEGKRGSYLAFANVFRREGKPCPRCGTAIVKLRVAGRGTHVCPHCQIKE